MRRTIREAPNQWAMLGIAWTLSLALVLVLAVTPTPYRTPLAFLPMIVGLGNLTLETARARIVIDAEITEFASKYATRRRRFATADLLRYVWIEKHGWAVYADGKATFVPIDEPWDFHAAVVEFAPKALKAKRLRTHQLPPAEDMLGLWTFDPRHPPTEVALLAGVLVAFAALLHTPLAVVVALGFLALVFDLRANGRLDLTAEALVERTPLRRREIRWEEATAIFCEDPKRRRAFVVTAPGRGIHVPAHLARDLETIRKLVYSLPQGTLCVNFDETTWRGYRRRKKAKEKAPSQLADLLPAPVSAVRSPGSAGRDTI